MKTRITRRTFIHHTSLAGAGIAALTALPAVLQAAGANDRVRVAVMGTNGRGIAHIEGFLGVPNVEIAYVCDVDSRALDKGMAAVKKRQATAPQGVKDFRRALDDKTVDVLSIAAPNHWHAPATILACAAGKHVYVEKPCSHNPQEGELMVSAARKHRRLVQMGNQRRSWPWMMEAIQRLKAGEIGRVTFARCWYNNARGSIGHGRTVPVPAWLDYDLWQGPAPRRPYRDNLIHYNWHWLWHWGNGELGNNGIHALDVARWGLGVDFPRRVNCGGSRYAFKDDQETPDIYVTTFDFGDKGACWESHSCHPRGFEGMGFGITFYGDQGQLMIAGNSAKILDPNGKERSEIKGRGGDVEHFGNLVEAIRDRKPLNSEIGEGAKSTLLCHLGNIAWRNNRTLDLDPTNGHIQGDRKAAAMWKRDYEHGWEPKV